MKTAAEIGWIALYGLIIGFFMFSMPGLTMAELAKIFGGVALLVLTVPLFFWWADLD